MKSVFSLVKDCKLKEGNYMANLKVKCIKSQKLVIRSFCRRNMKWQIRHPHPPDNSPLIICKLLVQCLCFLIIEDFRNLIYYPSFNSKKIN